MLCGLCHQETEFFEKSHIIPQAIMTDGLADGERLAIASTVDYPKKSPTGIWSRIVCSNCEDSFGLDDNYLVSFYRKINTFGIAFEGEATELTGIDPKKLRRSILSVAFRAHLSDHAMFRVVNFGPHADDLRQHLLQKDHEPPPAFSVALRHLTNAAGEALLGPIKEKYSGINTYRFFFPRFTALIRVDKRSDQYPFRELELGRDEIAYAMRFDRFSTSETRAFSKILQKHPYKIERALGIKK